MNNSNKTKIIIILVGCFILTCFLAGIFSGIVDELKYTKKDIDEKNKISNLNYVIDDKFEIGKYSDKVSTYYSYQDDDISCHIRINYYENYNNYETGEEYLRNNVNFYLSDEISDINLSNINNSNWYYLNKLETRSKYSSTETSYYAIIKGNDIYEVEYEIRDYKNGDYDKNNSFCNIEKNKFISSLKLK